MPVEELSDIVGNVQDCLECTMPNPGYLQSNRSEGIYDLKFFLTVKGSDYHPDMQP